MIRSARRLPGRQGLAALLAALAMPMASAQIDPLPLDLAGQYPVPLRWHNLGAAADQPVAGRRAEADPDRGWPAFTLAPGQWTLLRLPAGAHLRLFAGHWDAAGLEVAIGNGTGLYRHLPLLTGDDGNSRLLPATDAGPHWVRLARPPGADGPLRVAAFASRREPADTIAPYRRLWPLDGEPVSLRLAREAAGSDYWHLPAGASRSLTVQGPSRFLVQVRPHYRADEAETGQHLTLLLDVDGRPLARPVLPVGFEFRQPLFADGRPVVAGRIQEYAFEIPAGEHRLALGLSTAAWVRLLSLETPDYLLPEVNEPAFTAAMARTRYPADLRLSSWNETAATAGDQLSAPRTDPPAVAESALRLALDNGFRDGGLVASAALDALARQLPDSDPLRRAAGDMLGHYTALHPLVPERWPGAAPRRRLILATAPAAEDPGPARVIALQHRSAWARSLESGLFLPLPDPLAPLEFVLPERLGPSSLHLAVTADGGAAPGRLMLQLDDGEPQPLLFAPPAEAPGDPAPPTTLEALLLAQGEGVRSGGFARHQLPAPVARAATADVPLPVAVRRVRLWRADGTPLQAALGLRLAREYRWSETEWLGAAAAQGRETMARRLREALAGQVPAGDPPLAELQHSQWQGLLRTLRAEARLFAAGVSTAPPGARAADAPPRDLAAARRLLAAGQPLAAMEHAATALPDGEARWLQLEALELLGENFLAEQVLKHLMLTAGASDLGLRARARLAARYRAEGDLGALRRLHAAALLARPDDADAARALAEVLAADGDAALALPLALLQADPDRELVAAAALGAGWWQTLAEAAAGLPPPRRAYWLGWRALARGDRAGCAEQWRGAGDAGAALLAHLESGQVLAEELARPGPPPVGRWARWQAAHPGPHRWAGADHLVTGGAGSARLESVDRALAFTMTLAAPGQPARLQVTGPARLRLELRPVHETGSGLLEGWANIRSAGQHWVEPILGNSPAPGLAWPGQAGRRPGRAITREIELPAGDHELAIDAGPLPLLLRVARWQPLFSLGVLPVLDRDSLAAPAAVPPAAAVSAPWGSCARCVSIIGDGEAPPLRHYRLLDRRDRWLDSAGPAPARQAPATADADAAALAAGTWPVLLAPPREPGAGAARRRLGELLWLAEHQPDTYPQVLPLAESIAAATPAVADLGGLMERLRRRSGWQPVDLVAASAGQRSREVDRWEPEAPALRARQALLAPLGPGERLLPGQGRLVVAFDNPNPSLTRVVLGAEEVALQPPRPLTVEWQVDGRPPERLLLDPSRPRLARDLRLPAGRHVLRLGLAEPLADQWLRVSFAEAGGQPFAQALERFYHLATREQPVRAAIPGPAWLRIDEWRPAAGGGHTESRYRYLAADWEELVLPPRPGESEALFRLHVLGPAPARPAPALRPQVLEPVPVPPVPARLPPSAAPRQARLLDDLPLGGQDPGTGSLGLALQRRLGPEESGGGIDRYWEVATSWRRQDEDRGRYRRAEGLLRLRPGGGPSLGLRIAGADELQPLPLTVDWQGSLFAQRPVTPAGAEGGGEWAVELTAGIQQLRTLSPKSYHIPRLHAFARHQSLAENVGRYDPDRLDQDVFTAYRASHRTGLGIADTWYHRPWLDSLGYAGLGAVSNPPGQGGLLDHLRGRLGWRQLVGAGLLEAEYSVSRYLADGDRADAFSRRRLKAELSFDRWDDREHRHELGLGLQLDLDRRLWGLGVFWRLHGGNGRAYGDFRGGEVPFADLRRRQRPAAAANLLEIGDHD